MRKMKPKVHKGSLGAAANGGSRKLLVEVLVLGKNGGENGFTPPLLCFSRQTMLAQAS